MICSKDFDDCCKTGDIDKMILLRNNGDINILNYTKQCIIAMKNKHYDIVDYLFDIPFHNIHIDTNKHYIIKKACKNNLVEIVKKIICTTKNYLSPEQMIYIAFKNESLDVILYLMQLFSIFPNYVDEIFHMACRKKHMKMIKFFQQQYKNFYFEENKDKIMIFEPTLLTKNIM